MSWQQRRGDLEDLVEEQAAQVEHLAALIDQRNEIIDQMRAILIQRDEDDREILRQARIALSDWFIATYPHLYPGHGRPQLRVIVGGAEGTGRLF